MAGTHHSSNNSMTATSTTTHLEKKRSLSPESSEEVREVDISSFEQAAECLSQAFAVDEVARYFVDTDDMRQVSEEVKYKLHCDIIRYITAAHCYKGVVTTIGPDFDAVALWLPPGQNVDSILTTLRSGMWRLYYQLSPEGRHRFFNEFMPLLHDTKHDIMGDRDDDSYYLVYLGSKPSARGKGYARKLIESMSLRADKEQKPIYLESSSATNLPYYKKHGFEEKLDIVLTRGPKPVYLNIMVREPAPLPLEKPSIAPNAGNAGGGIKAKVLVSGGNVGEILGGKGEKEGGRKVGGSMVVGIVNGKELGDVSEARVGRVA